MEVRVPFGVLGALRITRAGTTVTIGSGMQRRLLATLLVHVGTVVSTDRLIAALWGDDPPLSALNSLRTYVYRLRGALNDRGELIAARPPGYILTVDRDHIDAGRFERLLTTARRESDDPRARLAHLDEALDLWRGPAFTEFADTEFARAEALRLDELRRFAVEERFECRLSLGQHAEVVGELEAFVASHPLRERARGQLMLALYRCGRQADALAVHRDLRNLLNEELGLEIPASLAELEGDILRQSPALAAPASGDRRAGSPDDLRVEAGSGTLPTELTSLVGREDDLAQVRTALQRCRIVTVTGVGGVGKTRLALRAARDVARDHPDGMWWCELAPVSDGDEVAHAVATTLGVRPSPGRTVTGSVVEVLRARRAMIVLDNCEHVRPGAAALARRIVRDCPQATVLATSRAPLGMTGEQVQRLAPLKVTASDPSDPDDSPAMRLFVERTRAVRRDLDLGTAELSTMAEICRRLDGLPLAIELAASRLRSLNPTDLADRLDDRLDLMVDVRQAEQGRHRGLRAVIDWSHGLLSPAEQRLFHRLSVFAGSFTLAAAEQVGAGNGIAEDEVLELLSGLVDHSLVVTLPTGGAARYALLETLRAYGRERLRDAEESDSIRRRHAEYHVALAEAADERVRGRDEAAGVVLLDGELDNLRAAHRWAVDQGVVDLALRLSAALFRYALWRLRVEVFTWAETAGRLPGAATHRLLPTVMGMAGWGVGLRGNLEEAGDLAERGLAVLDGSDDPRALVPLEVQMHVALWQGRLEDCMDVARRAAALSLAPDELVPAYVPCLALTYAGRAEEALALIDGVQTAADRVGNPTMRALTRYAHGEALLTIAPEKAGPSLEEAVELASAVDNRMVLGVTGVSLISLQSRLGETRQALHSFAAVIDALQGAGDWTHLWTGVRSLVVLLARLEQNEPAGVLLGAARGADTAPPAYGEDAERLAAVQDRLEQRLGVDAVAAAQARGRAMTDREAIAFARTAIDRCAHD